MIAEITIRAMTVASIADQSDPPLTRARIDESFGNRWTDW
jgi:hypothetical protein